MRKSIYSNALLIIYFVQWFELVLLPKYSLWRLLVGTRRKTKSAYATLLITTYYYILSLSD